MAVRLSQVIPWGRSFDEYRRMFDLSETDLRRRVLGCGDGPASFNAEATERGLHVISCDPIYSLHANQIKTRINECFDDIIAQVRKDPTGFVWKDFQNPEHLGRCRMQAMQYFLRDFETPENGGRYVAAALPKLPFAEQSFDLAVVSHLLFLYSDHLDLEFHWTSLRELLRVAREVRVFPLLTLAQGRSPHIEPLLDRCGTGSWRAEIREVPYEFQRGGNEMLIVRWCD